MVQRSCTHQKLDQQLCWKLMTPPAECSLLLACVLAKHFDPLVLLLWPPSSAAAAVLARTAADHGLEVPTSSHES